MGLDFGLFRSKSAQLILSAQLISQLGDRLMALAIIWVMASEHSPALASWLLAAGALPHLVLARYSPKILSRVGAIDTIISTDVIRGVVLLLLGLLLREQYFLSTPVLFSLIIFINFFAAFFNPAILMLPVHLYPNNPETPPKLSGLLNSCVSLASVIGPLCSVGVYHFGGLRGVVLVNGISYILGAALEYPLRKTVKQSISSNTTAEAARASGQTPPGIFELQSRNPFIANLLLSFFFLNLFLGPILVFIPLFVKNIYQLSISAVGILEMFFGISTVLGAVLISGIRLEKNKLPLAVTLIGLQCLIYLGFTFTTSLAGGVIFLSAIGLILSMVNVILIGLFQTHSSANELPTVMSAINLISEATIPLSMGALGLALHAAGDHQIQNIAHWCAMGSIGVLLMIVPTCFKSQEKLA